MNILMIGDIIGKSGVKKVKQTLPDIKNKYEIDFTIANGENTADGMGITSKIFNELVDIGVDVITMGNHTWAKKDIFCFIENKRIIRPANYPKGVVGRGYNIYECKNKRICVINLIGRVDMNVLSENPFVMVQDIIKVVKNKSDIILIDFHAEATAEKIALSYLLDGEVNAIFGTHTHVMTADEKIMEKGTAYITDVGMTGPLKSVIGMDVDASIKRFLTTLPERYKVSDDENTVLCGCIIQINEQTCRTEKIDRIKI